MQGTKSLPHTWDKVTELHDFLLDNLGLVLSRIAQDLYRTRSISAHVFIHTQPFLHLEGSAAGKNDAKGDTVLDGLRAALSLVWFRLVRAACKCWEETRCTDEEA